MRVDHVIDKDRLLQRIALIVGETALVESIAI
jgi:hypothetical protein